MADCSLGESDSLRTFLLTAIILNQFIRLLLISFQGNCAINFYNVFIPMSRQKEFCIFINLTFVSSSNIAVISCLVIWLNVSRLLTKSRECFAILSLQTWHLNSHLQTFSHDSDRISLLLSYKYFHSSCLDKVSFLPRLPELKRSTRLVTVYPCFTVQKCRCNRTFWSISFHLWYFQPNSSYLIIYNLLKYLFLLKKHRKCVKKPKKGDG